MNMRKFLFIDRKIIESCNIIANELKLYPPFELEIMKIKLKFQ